MIFEDEAWLPVIGVWRYSVSNFGRVYDHKKERCLIPTPTRDGYLRVKLWIGDLRMSVAVSRLVAFAFLGTPTADLEVNHIDGDKTYNYVGNLEWTTRSENMKHAYENYLSDIPNRQPVICVETNDEYRSIREAARNLGILSHKSITRVLNDPNKSTHGYHFTSKGVMP